MQEFSVIDAAKTAEQLKLRLKKSELEQFGKDLNPVSIYDAMKRIPRFVDMQVCLLFQEGVFQSIHFLIHRSKGNSKMHKSS